MRFFSTTLSFALTLWASLLFSPVQGQQLLVANGGVFGPSNHASLGVYEPFGPTYVVVDSVPAAFVSDVTHDFLAAFYAADSFLVKVDPFTGVRQAIVDAPGIRKIALYDTIVIATFGYGATGDGVQAFGQTSLSPLWSVSGISGECEGIAVLGDTAYVAVPGYFGNLTGKLAVIELPNGNLNRQIDFDTAGAGIGRVYATGSEIISLSSVTWGSPYGFVSHYAPNSGVVEHVKVGMGIGGVAGGIANGLLYAQFGNGIGTYDLTTRQIADSQLVAGNFAALLADPWSNGLYASTTDYFSYGRVYHYDLSAWLIDSFDVGISPEALAFIGPLNPAVEEPGRPASLEVWPQPAAEAVRVRGYGHEGRYAIYDLNGRILGNGTWANPQGQLDLTGLRPGLYLLQVESAEGRFSQRLQVMR